MARKSLIAILILSFILEAALCFGGFFLPEKTFKQFGVSLNNETAFLGYIISWFLLFVTLIIGIALWQVLNNREYKTLCYLLGFWWIGIGVGIYLMFKRPDNLALDSAKGLLLLLATRLSLKDSRSK